MTSPHTQSEIRSLETRYNGYRFRSRLEARWQEHVETIESLPQLFIAV